MNRLLITGASGFFGKSLLQVLEKTNTEDQFICLYHSQKGALEDPRFVWVKADLHNLSVHKELMQKYKPTHCVHLAWHVPPQNFWHAEQNLEWLQASVHLFQAFCEVGGKAFMGAGTLTEYEWSTGILEEEMTPLRPNSLYGQCKKSLYEIIRVIRNSKYKDTILIWPRIGYFFGESEPPQKLISRLINSISIGTSLKLTSKDTRRPMAHVKYLAESLAYILLNQRKDLVFNLSAPQAYTLEQVVNFISLQLNMPFDTSAYNSYVSPVVEPLSVEVKIDVLNKALGRNIPDTFFNDLAKMIEFKSGQLSERVGNNEKQKIVSIAQ